MPDARVWRQRCSESSARWDPILGHQQGQGAPAAGVLHQGGREPNPVLHEGLPVPDARVWHQRCPESSVGVGVVVPEEGGEGQRVVLS